MATEPTIWWIAFSIIVFALLAFDLGVFQRKAHAAPMKEAILLSCFYIVISLMFAGVIYVWLGSDKSFEFLTAYVLEKSLSVDNLFVFVTIFAYFKVDLKYQHRVLFWGILGALITRGVFIFVGMFAINIFQALIYGLGILLIYSAYKIMTKGEDELTKPGENRVLRLASKYLPIKKDYIGSGFVIREPRMVTPFKNHIYSCISKIPIINKLIYIKDLKQVEKTIFVATPLLLVLLVIESTDIAFATDSVPAVLAVSRDTFIVYTSNIFAILGLRALYFVVASMMVEFDYLKYGISVVLAFIGVKMLINEFYHISTGISLTVVVSCLAISVIASLIWKKEDKKEIKKAKKHKHETKG